MVSFESWFIPLNTFQIICIVLSILLAILFLLTIIYDRTCHTMPMLFVGNSCLIGIIFGALILGMRVFTLKNDLQQIEYRDIFCNFRGYLGYATCSIQNSSYLLQALYRYLLVVYPNRLLFQTLKFQLFLIISTWLFGFLYPLIFMFNGELLYNVDNHICQLPLHLSFSIIYMANFAYMTPVSLTMIVYVKLVRYVHRMSRNVISANTIQRAERELKMVRRTVILVSILFILCFPYALFIFLSFVTTITKYHFRITCSFLDTSYLGIICVVLLFTDPLKESLRKTRIYPFKQPMSLPTISQKEKIQCIRA